MKAVAIILIILCLAALVGVGYLYASSNLSVSFVECIANDPMVQTEYFSSLKESMENESFVGTRFTRDALSTPDLYQFFTWTVKLENRTFLDADVAEIQITPMSGDVQQIGDTNPHTVRSWHEGTLSATVLTSRSMHSVREAIVTWYFWGIPFSARVTLGK